MKNLILLSVSAFFITWMLPAQDSALVWDNTQSKNWPEGFASVEIKSTADGTIQKAVFYKTPLTEKQPLIVSLHTWSGDYLQEDPLAKEIVLRGWNYIHPDFRGPNNQPNTCGSRLVISDVEDAIRFAIENGNVDETEVHIIGVSGGGYATLVLFMKLDFPVKSFSAWAPISNLEDWYWECNGRGLKYATDIEQVTSKGQGFDAVEAQKRSPVLMDIPKEKRKEASLYIYTGIHDGYTGSIPISHSINMFNRLLMEMHPEQGIQLISDSLKLELLEKQMNPSTEANLVLGGRKIHLLREVPNLSLIIFEGSHEMLVSPALALIPVHGKRNRQTLNILTIGDSNAAALDGWPAQLHNMLPYSTIINESISGNTIGFDNLNNPNLNTLRNIQAYLDSATAKLEPGSFIDYLIFGLGTNDAKTIFQPKNKEVTQNLDLLIREAINYFKNHNKPVPKIVVLTPPPINEQLADTIKYHSSNEFIKANNKQFKKVAEKQGAVFIDTYSQLSKQTDEITSDGVHLTPRAQFKTATIIMGYLK